MKISLAALGVLTVGGLLAARSEWFPLLSSTVALGRQPAGFYLLPTNQLLRPGGESFPLKGRPVDMALDANKRLLAILNSRGIDVMDAVSGAKIAEIRTKSTSYTGIAFRAGKGELWASETTRNGPDSLFIQKLDDSGKPGEATRIDLPGHPLPCGIAFSPDGALAYVALSRDNSLAIVDATERKVIRKIPAGIAPFGVAVSRRQDRIFVSNRGGERATPDKTTAPSSGSEVVTNAETGSSVTGTVTMIDSKTQNAQTISVGLSPTALVLSPDERTLAVANSHSDSVSFLDTQGLARADVHMRAWPEAAIGSQPVAVQFAPDGKRVYVACAGTNAVAALSRTGAGRWTVDGYLPAGWFPTAISVLSDGSLRVLNLKGTGNTANAKGSFNSKQFEGTLQTMAVPLPAQLSNGTELVAASNSPHFAPGGGIANLTSLGIEHVLFIVKENRTYDQVLGDMPQGNGDPKLVMYGRNVTPNHHALAEQYVLLDNFHTGGAISFDGHQWLMQAFVSDYVERAFAASPRGYAWNMADALTVAPTGFFWQGAPKPPSLRIYGEFCLPAKWDPAKRSAIDIDEKDELSWTEYWNLYKAGKWQTEVGSNSGVPALQRYVDSKYPSDSTSIPDQIRAEEYLTEFAAAEKSGQMPQLTVLTLNNDHTNGTKPGSPTPRAMVADNDLALGRMVEAISKSRFWASTLILVVEDDAQDGLDHVDGHRTVALAIGPSVRRNAVDSTHYNHSSMVRTIQDIFRIPPRTRFAASARAMNSIFTNKPGTAAYKCLTPGVALDEMNPALRGLHGRRRWAAQASARMNWAEPDDVPSATLNRILWWDSKGYDKPYPQ